MSPDSESPVSEVELSNQLFKSWKIFKAGTHYYRAERRKPEIEGKVKDERKRSKKSE